MFQAKHRKPRGFNKKPAKRAQQENKVTLGARHAEKLKQFQLAQTKTLPAKEKQLAVVQKQLEKIQARRKELGGRLESVEYDQLHQLKEQRAKLRKEIEALQSRHDENKFQLKTAEVLHAHAADVRAHGTRATPAPPSSGAITRWLKKPAPASASTSSTTSSKITLRSWMKDKAPSERPIDRTALLESWCTAADPSFVGKRSFCHEQPNKCPDPECGAVNQIAYASGGRLNCSVCGTEVDIFFAPSFVSFKETKATELTPQFPYKRINHFQEWLSQIQGKQNTEIVEKVFNGLQTEFKKYNITDFRTLSPKFVKECLRKLGFTKYYEHAEYIIHHFNGLPPPVLTVETEELFRSMFEQIQIPFMQCKPLDRKNFLSYSYVFHQFAMLTSEDHLLEHFPLLKSRQKLRKADNIWRGMCKILRWQFIPSV